MANKAILLWSDDWEGLYVNGKLVDEGHTLNEGVSRTKYFVKLALLYNFVLEDMQEILICETDDINTKDSGSFPKNIDEFVGDYTT